MQKSQLTPKEIGAPNGLGWAIAREPRDPAMLWGPSLKEKVSLGWASARLGGRSAR